MSGLASGQDTQAIIDAMIKAKSVPLTTMSKQETEINADLAAWSELNTLMTYLTDSLDTLRTWETWNQMTATSSDDSNLTATASSSAAITTYKISITSWLNLIRFPPTSPPIFFQTPPPRQTWWPGVS